MASAMTTGPPADPHSAEGRLLGWLLSVYGLGIFGYLTATLASHFIEQDKASERVSPSRRDPDLHATVAHRG